VVSQDDDPPWEEDAEVVSRPVAKPKTLPPKKEVKNEDWDEVGDMDLEMFKKLVDD
jgi:hypothetical protein